MSHLERSLQQAAAAILEGAAPSVGVEEEYQLVDRESGGLVPRCREVMQHLQDPCAADIQHELHMSQIEMASPVCHRLTEVRGEVATARYRLIAAAEEAGCGLVAAGTNPTACPIDKRVTPKPRYKRMAERYQQLTRDLMIFGCHVHVSIPDRRVGLEVMNHARPALALLQALSANSPYWEGEDTGYASYRREMWMQWPMAGPPHYFPDLAEHDRCVAALEAAQAIEDASKIYWDVRLPVRHPTIEFRVFDMMTRLEEVVALVGLVRGLVVRWTELIAEGVAAPPVRQELLLAAMWQASRYGTEGQLIDPAAHCAVDAKQAVRALVAFARPALERLGDAEEVEAGIEAILRAGTGASRQRQTLASRGSQAALVAALRAETADFATCDDAAPAPQPSRG